MIGSGDENVAVFMPHFFVCLALPAPISPVGRSPNQDLLLFPRSVQTAVINVFKGGGLQNNELYALNENIR